MPSFQSISRRPSTAVILAAGRGGRRLPITRVIDKAMLPIGNRPVVDYVVEQCAEAGIERIVFVISTRDSLLKKYYSNQIDIAEEYPWLQLKGKITCDYVVQLVSDTSYGTAAALESVENVIAEECFIVVPADGFIDGSEASVMSKMIDAYVNDDGLDGVLAGLTMPANEAIVHSTIGHSGDGKLTLLNEKPTNLDQSKSYPVNLSYYLLPRGIFDDIRELHPAGGEYRLTDAVNKLAERTRIDVVPVEGNYLDAGQLMAWVSANQHITSTK